MYLYVQKMLIMLLLSVVTAKEIRPWKNATVIENKLHDYSIAIAGPGDIEVFLQNMSVWQSIIHQNTKCQVEHDIVVGGAYVCDHRTFSMSERYDPILNSTASCTVIMRHH